MFARRVSMHLKPNSVAEFTQTAGERSHSLASKTERVPGRNHVCRPGRNEGVRNQFVGQQRERGNLQPRNVSRSDEDPGESG